MTIGQLLGGHIAADTRGSMRINPVPGFEHLPTIEQPHVVAEELFAVMRGAIMGASRSVQTMIGPSEIGHPCPRYLIRRLDGQREPQRGVPWKATVGTAIHDWEERQFNADNERLRRAGAAPRWVCERRLKVGTVGGRDIYGSCDLFDTATRTVWDWKTTTPDKIVKYRLHGLKQQYRVQMHSYGRGWELLGYPPVSVGNVYLLRNGELGQSWVFAEPYDPQIAIDAVSRLEALETQRLMLGVTAALALHALCGDEWCTWCKAERPVLLASVGGILSGKR